MACNVRHTSLCESLRLTRIQMRSRDGKGKQNESWFCILSHPDKWDKSMAQKERNGYCACGAAVGISSGDHCWINRETLRHFYLATIFPQEGKLKCIMECECCLWDDSTAAERRPLEGGWVKNFEFKSTNYRLLYSLGQKGTGIVTYYNLKLAEM